MAQEHSDRVEGVDEMAARAHEAIDTARDQTQAVAGGLRDLVRDTSEKLKGTASAAGRKLERAASSVRDGLPREGMVGAAAGSVADLLESAGERLEKHDVAEVRKALEDLIHRRPFTTLLMSVGAGYLLARTLRR